MAPKQQRTLMDSWAEPAKRRRLNNNPVEETKQSPKSSNKTEQPDKTSTKQPKTTPPPPPKTTPNPNPTTKTLTTTPNRTSLFASPHPPSSATPPTHKEPGAQGSPHKTSALLGTTLLIPPQTTSASKSEREANHWIGCLFTSEKKGKGKGSEESILRATGGAAVSELVERVREVNDAATANSGADSEDGEAGEVLKGKIEGVRMCKINSGLFGVPWEATKAVIEAVEVGEGDFTEVVVCSLD
ncbi:hypothetical protein Q7P37_007225 [Cladosporium fusiforme]